MQSLILERARSLHPQISAWRQALHQIPEIGLELPQTCRLVQDVLREYEIPFRTLTNSSCVAALLGKPGPCILLRADMDGLNMEEGSGEVFASVNGCMHACGHDVHTASLLGAALLLKTFESELCGQVKLLFQPGEEIFAGAAAAIDAGILENPHVDAAFGMHIVPDMRAGVGAVCQMASVYGFQILLQGVGGHGSNPSVCADPITAGVSIHQAFQELIARERSLTQEAVLTIGQFSAGDTPNIIPDKAVLSGTLRTFDDELAQRLIQRIENLAKQIAAAYRVEAQVKTLFRGPVLTSNADMAELAVQCAKQSGLIQKAIMNCRTAGSEDFAYIVQHVPAAFLSYGCADKSQTPMYGLHHPKVRFSENLLSQAAAAYAIMAIEYLRQRKAPGK